MINCHHPFWLFSTDPLVPSTNKTDRHDITEILLKVALDTRELHLRSICLHAIKKEKKSIFFSQIDQITE
jgi:hypothetical protein